MIIHNTINFNIKNYLYTEGDTRKIITDISYCNFAPYTIRLHTGNIAHGFERPGAIILNSTKCYLNPEALVHDEINRHPSVFITSGECYTKKMKFAVRDILCESNQSMQLSSTENDMICIMPHVLSWTTIISGEVYKDRYHLDTECIDW